MIKVLMAVVFMLSFCAGAFAQSASDELSDKQNSGTTLDNPENASNAIDTDVKIPADLPEAGEPRQAESSNEAGLTPKEEPPVETPKSSDAGTTADTPDAQ